MKSLLAATDEALLAFESDMAALRDQDDQRVFEAIKRVVLALNREPHLEPDRTFTWPYSEQLPIAPVPLE